jgi:hypothetical protein
MSKSEESRLTLMRITVVEAANMVVSEGQPVRPYVTIRAGCQLGQTRVSGGFKWGGLRDGSGGASSISSSSGSGGRVRPGCAWRQSFDMVVRQQPASVDLEDILSLRLMSYQVADKCSWAHTSTV